MLPNLTAMNFSEAIIIYLACGAPFGVYYFVNQRNRYKSVLIQTIFITVVWIPFAFALLKRYFSGILRESGRSKKIASKDQEILNAKKTLEQAFLRSDIGISVFEIREVMDRYIGLSVSAIDEDKTDFSNPQFFEAAGNQNAQLALKCFQRRNRKLLYFHQTLAGQDFFNLIAKTFFDTDIKNVSLKLVQLLNDAITEKKLKLLFAGRQQIEPENGVQKSEKEIWIHDLQQTPAAAASIQISMKTTRAAKVSLPIKD